MVKFLDYMIYGMGMICAWGRPPLNQSPPVFQSPPLDDFQAVAGDFQRVGEDLKKASQKVDENYLNKLRDYERQGQKQFSFEEDIS